MKAQAVKGSDGKVVGYQCGVCSRVFASWPRYRFNSDRGDAQDCCRCKHPACQKRALEGFPLCRKHLNVRRATVHAILCRAKEASSSSGREGDVRDVLRALAKELEWWES